jgi:hypothetical protein
MARLLIKCRTLIRQIVQKEIQGGPVSMGNLLEDDSTRRNKQKTLVRKVAYFSIEGATIIVEFRRF